MFLSHDAFRPEQFSLDFGVAEIEPVDAAYVAAHTVLTEADDLALLESFISQARSIAEGRMRRRIMDQSVRYRLSSFPRAGQWIELPFGCPVRDVAIEYVGTSGGILEMPEESFEVVQSTSGLALIVSRAGGWWPPCGDGFLPVDVSWRCGWEEVEEVPEAIRGAVARLAADLYEVRAGVVEKDLVELPWLSAMLAQWSLPQVG